MANAPQPTSLSDLKPGLCDSVSQAITAINQIAERRPGWNVVGTNKAAIRQISHDSASKIIEPKIKNLTEYTCIYSAIRDEIMAVIKHKSDPATIDLSKIENAYQNYQTFYKTGGNKETQDTIGGMKHNPDETLGISEIAISELAPEAVKTVTQAAADAAYEASHKHGFRIDELLQAQHIQQTETSSASMTTSG